MEAAAGSASPAGVFGAGGRYRVLNRLGRGGWGEVFRAWDDKLEREVAVKVLRQHLTDQPAFRQRFKREARTIARLKHYNILQVYDLVDEGETYRLVMPLIAGGSLHDRLEAERHRPWTPHQALPLLRQVLAALTHAHGEGVLHRDVKPANVLLDLDGERAYLADFGLAKLVTEAGTTLTPDGAVVGTLEYMAPEQARGEPIDERADLYSVGVILYEMLAGRRPFPDPPAGESMVRARQYLNAIEQGNPAPLRKANPAVPETVEAAVRRALAKRREDRFKTAAEFLAELHIEGENTGASDELAKAQRQQSLDRIYDEARRFYDRNDWEAVIATMDCIRTLDKTFSDPDGLEQQAITVLQARRIRKLWKETQPWRERLLFLR